jgi:hypothetical protein
VLEHLDKDNAVRKLQPLAFGISMVNTQNLGGWGCKQLINQTVTVFFVILHITR